MEDTENNFLRFLNSLGEKPVSTVRFFDRQEYYSIYHEDAELLAKNFYKSLEVVKYFKRDAVPYINVNKNNSESLFRYLLINNQYRVEVYSSCGRSDKDSNWSLDYTASPGNLERFQDTLFGNVEVSAANTLLSLNIKKVNEDYRIFLGFCDLDNGILCSGSFEESCNSFDQLVNLTSALFQLNCRECLVPANDTRPEMISVIKTVERSGLLLTEVKKQSYSTENVVENLSKLVGNRKCSSENSVSKITEIEGQDILGCLGSIISYLDLMKDEHFYNFFDVQSFKLSNFMGIGEECDRALNILPSPNDIDKRDSLYGVLNSCRTSLGERLLKQWLKQPLLDINLINNRLDIVECFVTENNLRQSLFENYLRRVPDLPRITKRIQRSNATLQDLYKLYTTLKLAKEIQDLLYTTENALKHSIWTEFCFDLEEIVVSSLPFCEMVETNLDFSAIQNHDFKIRSDVDENLTECQRFIDQIEGKLNEEFNKVTDRLQTASKKQIKLEVSNSIGYYMRISRKEESILRGADVILLDTLKDGVKFHSHKMKSLNDEYRQHRLDYDQYQGAIVDSIMKSSSQYIAPLHKLGSVFAKLDVFCSFAVTVVGAPAKYVRPKLFEGDTRRLMLKNCRHPIVEMQQNVSYIANDACFDENHTFQIITGPNMGGKSTYIRSIGLCVIMAQVGCFVPCDEAELTLFDRVMTRIGAGDCILKGVSTFMSEMLDVSWILKTATPRSLLIIDELGRGTSTFDGFGLAWSISEHLVRELRSFSLFATHFHELTELAAEYGGVSNVHVTAQTVDDALVLLYKVVEGASGKSYGIEVGKCAGLSDSVLALATQKLEEYEAVQQWQSRVMDEQTLETLRTALRALCEEDITSCDVASVTACLKERLSLD